MRMCSILCTSHKIEKLKLQYHFLSSGKPHYTYVHQDNYIHARARETAPGIFFGPTSD